MSVPPFKCRNSLIHTLAAPGIQESSSPHFFPLPLTRRIARQQSGAYILNTVMMEHYKEGHHARLCEKF